MFGQAKTKQFHSKCSVTSITTFKVSIGVLTKHVFLSYLSFRTATSISSGTLTKVKKHIQVSQENLKVYQLSAITSSSNYKLLFLPSIFTGELVYTKSFISLDFVCEHSNIYAHKGDQYKILYENPLIYPVCAFHVVPQISSRQYNNRLFTKNPEKILLTQNIGKKIF